MVTKQEQLEWLAKECDEWPVNGEYFTMNRHAVGACVHAHVITREEWKQERDKMQKQAAQPTQDNSWFERGERPPVGALVEKKYKSATTWTEVKIIVAGNQLVIFAFPDGDEMVGDWSDYDFRPIRTDREKAIDEMMTGYQSAKGDKPVHPRCRFFAEYLYDAGYRKQQGGDK